MDHFVTYRYIVLTLYKAACWRLLVSTGTSKNCKKLPKMGILDPDIYPDSTLFEPFLSKIFLIIPIGWFIKGHVLKAVSRKFTLIRGVNFKISPDKSQLFTYCIE